MALPGRHQPRSATPSGEPESMTTTTEATTASTTTNEATSTTETGGISSPTGLIYEIGSVCDDGNMNQTSWNKFAMENRTGAM